MWKKHLFPFMNYEYCNREYRTPIIQKIKNWLKYKDYNFSSINTVFDIEMDTMRGIICNRCGVKEYRKGTCFQYRHGFSKEWEDEFILCEKCSDKFKLYVDKFKMI